MADSEKFKTTLIQHIPGLLRYAIALVGNYNNAEDLVQDCLERALNKSHLWDQNQDLKPWLHAILHNLYIDSYRKNSLSPIIDIDIDDVIQISNATQWDHLAVRDLLSALNQLPNEQKEIILMVALEGLSYKEISEIINVPVGTIMSRLHRGRHQLRTLLLMHSDNELAVFDL